MRQYYDTEGNPIQRRHQQTNENREIVLHQSNRQIQEQEQKKMPLL
jgi:hypothetical protein